MIIDTHCHLDDKRYLHDLDSVIENAKKAGVGGMIIPAADPADLKRAKEISQNYKEVYFSIGTHPYHVKDYDKEYLLEFANHPKCVAVGECGLDYYRFLKDEDPKEQILLQKRVFKSQIELALELKKPLIVHIREASIDAKELLLMYDIEKIGAVLHCYNANRELLKLSEHGCYFGIGGIVTFKNAKELVDILADIPLDKIVLETDAPYLAPHPYRGKRNEPAYTKFVLKKVAEILNEDENRLRDIFLSNTKNLFKELFK